MNPVRNRMRNVQVMVLLRAVSRHAPKGGLMRTVRNWLLALTSAMALFAAAPAVSQATTNPATPTLVPDKTDVRVFMHPCQDTSGVKSCKLVVTTKVPAHYELPHLTGTPLSAVVTQALACYGTTYYNFPSIQATDYTGWNTVATNITLSAENSYNGCTAGAVWVHAGCYATPGWNCLSGASHGGFWDSGNGYYQDWANQDTSNVFGAVVSWYLRIHVYPTGNWARWCYNSGVGSC